MWQALFVEKSLSRFGFHCCLNAAQLQMLEQGSDGLCHAESNTQASILWGHSVDGWLSLVEQQAKKTLASYPFI